MVEKASIGPSRIRGIQRITSTKPPEAGFVLRQPKKRVNLTSPPWWYWLGILTCVLVPGIALLGLHVIGAGHLLDIPMYFFLLYVVLAVVVKRLHDQSGWWVIPFVFLPGLLEKLSDRMAEGTALQGLFLAASSALAIWGLIELGFLKGTDGSNQYGPDPLATGEDEPESMTA